jgi:hypothetical protein
VFGEDIHAAPEPSAREEAVLAHSHRLATSCSRILVLSFSSGSGPGCTWSKHPLASPTWSRFDQLFLGDLYIGEARTEVVRLAIPSWSAGEDYRITVSADYREARSGRNCAPRRKRRSCTPSRSRPLRIRATGTSLLTSGLAMVKRLERAFAGSAFESALAACARGYAGKRIPWRRTPYGRGTRRLAQQAEVLSTLLAVVEDDKLGPTRAIAEKKFNPNAAARRRAKCGSVSLPGTR